MANNSWLQGLFLSGADKNEENDKVRQEVKSDRELVSALADAMSQLNVAQRETVLEELHGINSGYGNNENASFVASTLDSFEAHMNSIKRGTVYEVAEAMDRTYVSSDRFRLTFLRANNFHIGDAAEHMINFLDTKRLLFGPETLVRSLRLDDLDEDDIEHLESGSTQISPYKDVAGRSILIWVESLRKFKSSRSELRVRFYFVTTAIEAEEEPNEKGMVGLFWGYAKKRQNGNSGALWKSLPVKWAGVHGCFNDKWIYLLTSTFAVRNMPPRVKPYSRSHFGSPIECLYELSSFGIPKEALPLDENYGMSIEHHRRWYRHQQRKELLRSPAYSTSSDASMMSDDPVVPSPKDVLFGKLRKHEGNLILRKIILDLLDEYEGASKSEKTRMAERVIESVHAIGGRFLKRNEVAGEWQLASRTEACRKIAHTFRNSRRIVTNKTGGTE